MQQRPHPLQPSTRLAEPSEPSFRPPPLLPLKTTDDATGALSDLSTTIREEAQLRPINVNLSTRKITYLPAEIGLLVDLERLGLNNNLLSTLPPEFNKLTSLRYLNLRSNGLRDFPAPLTELSRLEVLDLSKNKIERLPNQFGTLMNLRVLSISRNRIHFLPKYVASMRLLQILKLDHNPFVWPPPQILTFEGENAEAAWLDMLKAFLLNEDPPAHLLVQEMVSRRGAPQHPTVSSASTVSLSTATSFLNLKSEECTEAIREYCLTSSASLPLLIVGDGSSSAQNISKAFLFATGELYAIARLILAYLSRITLPNGGIISDLLSLVTTEREMKALNREALELLTVHRGIDHTSSEAGSHTLLENSTRGRSIAAGDNGGSISLNTLKSLTRCLSQRLHTVVETISGNILPVLFENSHLDGPLAMSILCDWHKANAGISSAIQLIHLALLGVPGSTTVADISKFEGISTLPQASIELADPPSSFGSRLDTRLTHRNRHIRSSSASSTLSSGKGAQLPLLRLHNVFQEGSLHGQPNNSSSTPSATTRGLKKSALTSSKEAIVGEISQPNAATNTASTHAAAPVHPHLTIDVNALFTDIALLVKLVRDKCTASLQVPDAEAILTSVKTVDNRLDSCRTQHQDLKNVSVTALRDVFTAVVQLHASLRLHLGSFSGQQQHAFGATIPVAARILHVVKQLLTHSVTSKPFLH